MRSVIRAAVPDCRPPFDSAVLQMSYQHPQRPEATMHAEALIHVQSAGSSSRRSSSSVQEPLAACSRHHRHARMHLFLRLVTLVSYSEKCNVTVWRPSVCQSVCLYRRHTHRDSPRGSIRCDLRTFRPIIRRTDIFVFSKSSTSNEI